MHTYLQLFTPSNKAFTFLLLVALLLLEISLYWFLSPQPVSIPKGKRFHGIKTLTPVDKPWERPFDAQYIVQRLRQPSSACRVIAGPSGAGKSTIVRTQVIPTLEASDWSSVFVEAHSTLSVLQHQLIEALTKRATLTPEQILSLNFTPSDVTPRDLSTGLLLIVIDQAEQLVYRTARDLDWLVCLLRRLKEMEFVRLLMVVRSDYFLRLAFLGDLLPRPDHVMTVLGLDRVADDVLMRAQLEQGILLRDTVDVFLDELSTQHVIPARRDSDVLRVADIVLPLELQVLGLMLETVAQKKGAINVRTYRSVLQGKNGIVRSYFKNFIDASPDPDVCECVLCCLSHTSSLRRAFSLDDLAKATYFSEPNIIASLTPLIEGELVLQSHSEMGTMFEWAHDFLSTAYSAFSAAEMDAQVRENLVYAAERIQHGQRVHRRVQPLSMIYERLVVWKLIMAYSLLCIVARCAIDIWKYFDQESLTGAIASLRMIMPDAVSQYLPLSAVHVPMYLPFGIAHGFWAYFVYRLLIIPLRVNATWQWGVAICGVIAVIVTCIWPVTWLLSIATIGGMTGLLWWKFAFDRLLSNRSKRRIWQYGFNCVLGSLGVAVAGIWYMRSAPDLRENTAVAWLLSTVVCLLAALSIAYHTMREGTLKWFSILDRTR